MRTKDAQVRKLMEEISKHGQVELAALRGRSTRSAPQESKSRLRSVLVGCRDVDRRRESPDFLREAHFTRPSHFSSHAVTGETANLKRPAWAQSRTVVQRTAIALIAIDLPGVYAIRGVRRAASERLSSRRPSRRSSRAMST